MKHNSNVKQMNGFRNRRHHKSHLPKKYAPFSTKVFMYNQAKMRLRKEIEALKKENCDLKAENICLKQKVKQEEKFYLKAIADSIEMNCIRSRINPARNPFSVFYANERNPYVYKHPNRLDPKETKSNYDKLLDALKEEDIFNPKPSVGDCSVNHSYPEYKANRSRRGVLTNGHEPFDYDLELKTDCNPIVQVSRLTSAELKKYTRK